MIGLKTIYKFEQSVQSDELKEILEEQKNLEDINFDEGDVQAFINYLDGQAFDMIYENFMESIAVAAKRFCDDQMLTRMVNRKESEEEQRGWDKWKSTRGEE